MRKAKHKRTHGGRNSPSGWRKDRARKRQKLGNPLLGIGDMAFEDYNGDLSTRDNPALEDHCLNCLLARARGLANDSVSHCKRVTLLIPHPQRAPPSTSFV